MPSRSLFIATMIAVAMTAAGCAELFTYRQAFEVTVDLSVGSERLQITRRILCEGEVQRDLSLHSYVVYTPSSRAFGARLQSGAAVLVVTPAFCKKADEWESTKTESLEVPSGHIPLIGWTDRADHPKMVELYLSKEYLDGSGARIRFHGMSARIIDSQVVLVGSVDAFSWFGKSQNLNFGYHAAVIPQEGWQELGPVADHVRNLTGSYLLPDDLSMAIDAKFRTNISIAGLFGGTGIWGTPNLQHPTDLGGTPEKRQILANVFPLFMTTQGFAIRSAERGYFVFYPMGLSDQNEHATPTVTILLYGSAFSIPAKKFQPFAVYNSTSKTITVINRNPILFEHPIKQSSG